MNVRARCQQHTCNFYVATFGGARQCRCTFANNVGIGAVRQQKLDDAPVPAPGSVRQCIQAIAIKIINGGSARYK